MTEKKPRTLRSVSYSLDPVTGERSELPIAVTRETILERAYNAQNIAKVQLKPET